MTRHHPAPFDDVSADLLLCAGSVICCMSIACLVGDTLGAMDRRLLKGTQSRFCTASLLLLMFQSISILMEVHSSLATPSEPSLSAVASSMMSLLLITHSQMVMQKHVMKVKHLIMKTTKDGNIDDENFDRSLFEIRNTPRPDGRSPSQVLMGRSSLSAVPAHC